MIPSLWELLNFSLVSLNAQIIWGNQNAARINKPYIMVSYTTVAVPDHEIYGPVDANGIRINSSWRRAVVELQFYCGQHDSYQYASKAVSLLATNASIDKQWLLDVSIGHRLMLNHVPALMNESQWEDRAIYQFEFYYTENIPDDVGLIETVKVSGEYDTGGDYTLDCDETISIADAYVDPRT